MLFLPSRGRPGMLKRFFEYSRPREPGIVYLDDDDSDNYVGVVVPDNWKVEVNPRMTVVEIANHFFRSYPDEPWYGAVADDLICSPDGWDTTLGTSAIGFNVAWADDLINGDTLAGVWFVGGDLARAIGWLNYPGFGHLYGDNVWTEIGRALGTVKYHSEIMTEHLHWSTGKSAYDRTAAERKTKGDRETYEAFMTGEFPQLVARLSLHGMAA